MIMKKIVQIFNAVVSFLAMVARWLTLTSAKNEQSEPEHDDSRSSAEVGEDTGGYESTPEAED